jgi:hypothetical protein
LSAETYKTVFSGSLFFTSIPIALARCVFPKPPPPYINKGLNDGPPGFCETAKPADLASLLHSPSTYESKVYY